MMYYENGKLQAIFPYKNGKQEGVAKWYSKDGKLQASLPYKNDKKSGAGKGYYPNGKLGITATFKNDKAISGKCSNGKVLTEADFKYAPLNIKNCS